jgi:hypothetical protein
VVQEVEALALHPEEEVSLLRAEEAHQVEVRVHALVVVDKMNCHETEKSNIRLHQCFAGSLSGKCAE